MHSQFNLQETASFSTSPFKPSKSSQMSPFQGLGNAQSSMLSHLLNNNPYLIGNNGNSNFLNLIHPSNHLKGSNNQFGGNKSNCKENQDNQEESVSLVASYAQYISNFESSLQPFPATSNADSNNQYFSNFYNGGNGHSNNGSFSNNLNSQSFSFGGSSAFGQNTNHHNHNCQQTPQNLKRSHNGGAFDEGFGNDSIPLLSAFTSDSKKLPMEHLSWLEKKTLMKSVPQKTINSKRKRDALLPPSTAASSMNDAGGSSSKIPKKVAVERGSTFSILANASGSSQQKEQLNSEDENKVRTRGGLIEQMKLQRQQILLQKEVDDEGDIVKKKNKKSTKKISETIKEIYSGEKPKKQIQIQEKNLSQAKKCLFQRKQTEQLENNSEKVSQRVQVSSKKGMRLDELGNQRSDYKGNQQERRYQNNEDILEDKETINGKNYDDNDVDIDDVEILIEKDYEGFPMKQHRKFQTIEESNSDELNVKSEEENEEQSQENYHKISNPKPKRTYKKQPKSSNPIEQMNPEKTENETFSAAQRAQDMEHDEHIRNLLEEAEYMGRVYSLIGSCVGGLVTQIRQQYLDQQLLSTFTSRKKQMNPQFVSQQLPSEIRQQSQIPFLGQKTKKQLNRNKNPVNLRQSKS